MRKRNVCSIYKYMTYKSMGVKDNNNVNNKYESI